MDSGDRWDVIRDEPVAKELRARYPEFFAVILDPTRTHQPDLRPLRTDLEAQPATSASYDALNAIAIAYFELNYRAQSQLAGPTYLADSFRAAKLVAVPWRAYGEVEEPALRGAILDFFADAGSGEKSGTRTTAPRLLRVVQSLTRKEPDPGRRARIEQIVADLEVLSAEAIREAGEP